MSSTVGETNVVIGADLSGLTSGFQEAVGIVKAGAGQMGGAFAGLGEMVKQAAVPFAAFAALLAGGAMFKSAIDETRSWTAEVKKLAGALGITTVEASGLAKALNKLGIDSETYLGAVRRLEMSLKSKEDVLNANRIATRNAAGEELTTQEVMQNTIERLREMEVGHERNQLAMLAFGRSGMEMLKLQRLTNKELAEGAKEARAFALEVTERDVKAMNAYNDAMRQVGDAFEAARIRIGRELLPALTALAEAFNSIGPYLADVIVGAFHAFRFVSESVTTKLALLAVVLKMVLWPALMAATEAVVAFAGAVTMKMGIAVAHGVSRLSAFNAAALAGSGPLILLSLAVVGVGLALEHLAGAREREMKAMEESASKAATEAESFGRLSEKIRETDTILKSTIESDERKKKALADQKIAVDEMESVYPGFIALLTDENGKQRSIAEALKIANAERIKEIQIKVANMEATRAAKQQEIDDIERLYNVEDNSVAAQRVKNLQAEVGRLSKAIAETSRALQDVKDKTGDAFEKTGLQKRARMENERLQMAAKFADEETKLRLKKDGEVLALIAKQEEFGADGAREVAARKEIIEKNYQEEVQRLRESYRARFTKADLDMVIARTEGEVKIRAEAAKSEMELEDKITQARRTHNDAEAAALEKELAATKAANEEKLGAYIQAHLVTMSAIRAELAIGLEVDEREKMRLEGARQVHDLEVQRDEARSKGNTRLIEELDAQIAKVRALTDEKIRQYEIDKLAEQAGPGREDFSGYEAEPDRQVEAQKKATAEVAKLYQDMDRQVEGSFQRISSGWASALSRMMQGQMKFRDFLKATWDVLKQAFFDAIAQMLAKWVVAKLAETILGKTSAVAQALRNQAVAATGAAAAMAAVPFVGPMLATAAYADMMALLAPSVGVAATAAGGYDIPAGVNPLVQAHEKEMILPAKHADVIRDLADNGGGAARDVAVNISFPSLSPRDAARSFRDYRAELVAAVREALREGR